MPALNSEQLAVVNCRERRVIVLAGAGTGKTATSVHWVASRLRESNGTTRAMMLTFTRKAAEEMRDRVIKLLTAEGRSCGRQEVLAGTYHAVAAHLMRRQPQEFGLRDGRFTVLDDSEQQSIWKSAFKQCGVTNKSPEWIPTKVAEAYSLARNRLIPLQEMLREKFPAFSEKIHTVINAYEKLKALAHTLDYDDLLTRWLASLRDNAHLRSRLRSEYKYVLVDEMQDNNRLNAEILRALDPEYLLVVGDVNQSIYGFRGADPGVLVEYLAGHNNGVVKKLSQNYRSGQTILELANQVVAGCDLALALKSVRGVAGRVSARVYEDTSHEAAGVLRWLREHLDPQRAAQDTAVLARSSQTLEPLEAALTTAGIRYQKFGGLTLADSAEVKDFIAFLRVAENPRDRVALLRALTQFPGVGEVTAAQFFAHIPQDGSLPPGGLWPAPARPMYDWLQEIRNAPTLGEKGQILLEKITPLISAHYTKDAPERVESLRVLVDSMRASPLSMVDFLDSFQLSRNAEDKRSHGCLTLSTIHSAKGLEWKRVWLMGCGDNQMPHPRAVNDAEQLAEERRLFYVAVTRARDELVLSYPEQTRRGLPQEASRFAPASLSWQSAERGDALQELADLLPQHAREEKESLLVQLFLAQGKAR